MSNIEQEDEDIPESEIDVQSDDISPRKRQRANSSGGGKKLPYLNTFDVPEFMKGAQPGASAVQKAEFEDRCKLLWRKSQAEESRRVQEANQRAQVSMEETVQNLRDMFPSVEEQLVRDTLLQHDCNAQAAASVLIVLSGAAETTTTASASSTAKPKSPPANVPKHDDLTEFPSMPPRMDSKGWEIMPGYLTKEISPEDSSEKNWSERASGKPEDWAEVNAQVSSMSQCSSPKYQDGRTSPKPLERNSSPEVYIDELDEHELRKGIGEKARVRDCKSTAAKTPPVRASKPPK